MYPPLSKKWKGGVYWRGFFMKYFYELRERFLERGVYWIVGVCWNKYGNEIVNLQGVTFNQILLSTHDIIDSFHNVSCFF